MKIRPIILLALILILLVGCGKAAKPAAEPQNAPQQPAPAVEAPAAPAAQPNAAPAASPTDQPSRGQGNFDLDKPSAGLQDLNGYRASLALVFDGTQNGQPYHVEKRYELVVDTTSEARFLLAKDIPADGEVTESFSGMLGPVRYVQPALDQPCYPTQIDQNEAEAFEPARLLPGFRGGEAAGSEEVNGTAASVYTFNEQALNAGEDVSASGKVWVATNGGWIVKYELTLKSDTRFGDGIKGEQRWSYEVRDTNAVEAQLPESCPAPTVDLPIPSDAEDLVRLPGVNTFTSGMSIDAIGAMYESELTSNGWTATDKSIETTGGTRWMYSKPVGDKQAMLVITAQIVEGVTEVSLFQMEIEPQPAE
jgi:hypothetical protein